MSDKNKSDQDVLSEEETRQYVTSYAFGVADKLLGLPLASPTKRLLAISIDAIIIGLLANTNATFLGVFILLTSLVSLYTLRGQSGRRFAKCAFSFIAVISLLLLSVSVINQGTFDEKTGNDSELVKKGEDIDQLAYQNDSVSPAYELTVSALRDASGTVLCSDTKKCDDVFFNQVIEDVAFQKYDNGEAKAIFHGLKQFLEDSDRLNEHMDELSFESFLYEGRLKAKDLGVTSASSIVRWVETLVDDIGLSIGWAALYFSVFIAWWEGQTIGKRLLGIRVLKISGKGLDLWESFERYAGYAAGFATGMLGFMQVCWDSNRQAIHDKISETVVVDLRKKSRNNKA